MDLFYRESGNGEPVIMIHGLMGMSDNWIPVARGMAGNYRMVMPDLRNHGNSPHHNDFNLNVLTEDIYALCQKLKINSAVFIGLVGWAYRHGCRLAKTANGKAADSGRYCAPQVFRQQKHRAPVPDYVRPRPERHKVL